MILSRTHMAAVALVTVVFAPYAAVVAAPMRWILRGQAPESGRDVAVVVGLYAAVVLVLSVPIILLGWPATTGWWGFPYNV